MIKYITTSLAVFSLIALCLPLIACAEITTLHLGFEAPAYAKDAPLQDQDHWSVGQENSEGATIRGNDAGITPPEGVQMLEITRQVGTEIPTASRIFASLREAIHGNLTFSFLATADTASNAAFKIGIGTSYEAQSGAWVSLRKSTAGNGFGFFYWDGHEEKWNQIGEETISLGEFVRFQVSVHAETMNFSVKILGNNGTLLAEKNDIPLWDIGGNLASGKGFNRIHLAADQHGPTRFFLDDIKVESTP